MPGIATPQESGGIGFDYRLAMGTPDYWIKLIKEQADEAWDVGTLYYELTRKRPDEKTVGYVESHDQALVGDQTLIFRLIGKDMYTSMEKKSQSLAVDRGMALHKMIRLITLATAGDGYLTFMGNEFGHPEWIDFPREGNGWSYQYARRQWDLLRDKQLRYHWLADFDRDMIELVVRSKKCFDAAPQLLYEDKGAHILAFRRGGLVFVFNFHPVRSYTDYGIPVEAGKYRIMLDSDNVAYGGFGRVDDRQIHYTDNRHYLNLYLPARSALALEKIPTPSLLELL
jgi:1,4-alpha-glucan branching enzyme